MNSDVLLLINGWAGDNDALDSVMVFCAHYLIYILFAVTAGCVGYLLHKRQWKELLFFFMTLGISFVILLIASQLYISDRPFVDLAVTQLLPHEANQSFPSDHATGSMTIALALLVFTRFKKIGWLLVLVAAIVGFSRIFVGVHYPFDIIGGIMVGLLGTSIVYIIRRFLQPRSNTTLDDKSSPQL